MKKNIITFLLAMMLPVIAFAQDDMYFVPAKKDKVAKVKKPKTERSDVPFAGKTYYIGIDMSEDQYNRRHGKLSSGTYVVSDSVVYSSDSIASDIISFAPVKNSQNVQTRDTMYVFVSDAEDYRYSRYLSMWDDFYWNRYFYGPGWTRFWYWHRNLWYDPWMNPWYDPWYYDYAYGPYWSGRWFYPWGFFPSRYDYWYSPYPHPYYITYGGGSIGGGSSRPGRHPGVGGHGGVVVRSTSGTSGNNVIARRNGDYVNRFTGYGPNSRGWNSAHNNARGYDGGNYTRSESNYTPSAPSSYSGGGGYSRGSGSGSFSSGGGGVSRSSGGGGHSAGRR